jgi:hypothetical protein
MMDFPETSAAGFQRFPDHPSLTDHTATHFPDFLLWENRIAYFK